MAICRWALAYAPSTPQPDINPFRNSLIRIQTSLQHWGIRHTPQSKSSLTLKIILGEPSFIYAYARFAVHYFNSVDEPRFGLLDRSECASVDALSNGPLGIICQLRSLGCCDQRIKGRLCNITVILIPLSSHYLGPLIPSEPLNTR